MSADREDRSVAAEEKTMYSKDGAASASMEADLAEGDQSEFLEVKELRRGLDQRHIQMIALAGTIGTGLFLGSGKAIAQAGPLGALMGYTFVGLLACAVVMSVAEMSALLPLSGGIIRHAEYFVDPALAFANGWNQVYGTMISLPAELVAAAVLVQFWSTINPSVWIVMFGVLTIVSNLLFVRVYGELEFTFASLKIMLIIGLNIMALVVTCGGGPDHHRYGFEYWRNPGPFVEYLGFTGSLGHFMGFWTTFSNAIYAYAGIEYISLAASETKSPRRNIPIAAKRVFWRVLIFYVLSIFMVGLIVPSNDEKLLFSTGTASQSPFVIAATNAGIKVVPSIINAVILTSAWSSGNSGILGASRILYGMSREGHAPKVFQRVNRFGIPYVAVCFMGLWVGLAFMSLDRSASEVFGWLQNLVSIAALVNWMVILAVYLRFHYGCKKQGICRNDLPWKGPGQPYAAWVALVSLGVLLLTSGYVCFIPGHWDSETFVSSYINIPIIIILYFGFKFTVKTKIIALEDIPIRRFMEIAAANPEEPAKKPKGWRRLNILWS